MSMLFAKLTVAACFFVLSTTALTTINHSAGTILWDAQLTPGFGYQTPLVSSAADTAFVANFTSRGDNVVSARDLRSGKLLWTQHAALETATPMAVPEAHAVLFFVSQLTSHSVLQLFSARTGELVRNVSAGPGLMFLESLVQVSGAVVYGVTFNVTSRQSVSFVAVNVSSGQTVWRTPIPTDSSHIAFITLYDLGETVLFRGYNESGSRRADGGHYVGVSARTGRVVYTKSLVNAWTEATHFIGISHGVAIVVTGGGSGGSEASKIRGFGATGVWETPDTCLHGSCQALLAGDVFYYGYGSALNVSTGAVITHSVPNPTSFVSVLKGSSANGAGPLLQMMQSNEFYAFASVNGSTAIGQVWSTTLEVPNFNLQSYSATVVAANAEGTRLYLVVQSNLGPVGIALDAATGTQRWSAVAPPGHSQWDPVSAVVANGVVLFSDTHSNVYAVRDV